MSNYKDLQVWKLKTLNPKPRTQNFEPKKLPMCYNSDHENL